jgi:hypothetical protein
LLGVPPTPETGGSPPYEPVVATYLTQVLGPDRAQAATRRALAELARRSAGPGGAPPDSSAVGDVAQIVALNAIDAEVRGLGRRIARAATGHFRCSTIARRLRDRAQGRMTGSDLSHLYYHLERCSFCSGITGRFEAGQWYLQVELASLELPVAQEAPAHEAPAQEVPAQEARAPVEPPVPPAPVPVEQPAAEVVPPQIELPVTEEVQALEPPAAAPPPVDPPPPVDLPPPTDLPPMPPQAEWPQPRGQSAYRGRRRALLLTVLLVAVAAAVFLVTENTGKKSPKSASTKQTTTSLVPRTTPPPAPAPAAGVAGHGTGTPFVLAGARFAVFVNARQKWTTFAKTVSPGPGNRWLLVTVRVRNLTRTALNPLDPRALHYRLVAPGGVNYFPNLSYGTGPDVSKPPRPLGRQALTQAELAFEVPTSAPPLQLVFDPYGRTGSVSVALGQ